MSPDDFKLSIDVVTLILGAVAVLYARKSALGGVFGKGMNFILFGIIVLTLNHFLDTVYLGDSLKTAGHTKDYLQGPIVHRLINLFGFVLVTVGFLTFNKVNK